MSSETALRGVPEIFEVDIDECIQARNDALAAGFRELGPLDLVHIVKTTSKQHSPKEIGSYHYVLGVDCSSSASIAAYLNSLTYSMVELTGWFAKNPWKITRGVFCCYNAFSKVDMRVEARIPGGVRSYCLNSNGQKTTATAEHWVETSVSAVLRAIHECNAPSLAGLRRMDPLLTDTLQRKFLESAKMVFSNAWSLGCASDIQMPTTVFNHLTEAIHVYFRDIGRPDVSLDFFSSLLASEPGLAGHVAACYFDLNKQVEGINFLCNALQSCPFTMAFPLLYAQCRFLIDRKQFEKALPLAKLAVENAASEFKSWALLTLVYIELGQYESALLALNSCPMYSILEKDEVKMPPCSRVHVPLGDGSDPKFDQMVASEQVDVALQQLQSPYLKGTFMGAYEMITKVCHKIGWDELLAIRSKVFVMEEEYRLQHTGSANSARGLHSSLDSRSLSHSGSSSRDDMASKSRGDMPSLEPSSQTSQPVNAPESKAELWTSSTKVADLAVSLGTHLTGSASTEHATRPDKGNSRLMVFESFRVVDSKPDTSAGEEVKQAQGLKWTAPPRQKRLCERWLDHLFMVLYEDLRVAMVWKAEAQHLAAQHLEYRRSPTEWEILGELAARLYNFADAKEAYQKALEARPSVKAYVGLGRIFVQEGKLVHALTMISKLFAHRQSRCDNGIVPSPVASLLFKLVKDHGHLRVSNTLKSMNVSMQTQSSVDQLVEIIQLVKPMGIDY